MTVVDPQLTELGPEVGAFIAGLDIEFRNALLRATDSAIRSVDLTMSVEENIRRLHLLMEAGEFDEALGYIRELDAQPRFLEGFIAAGHAVPQSARLADAALPTPDPGTVADAVAAANWLQVAMVTFLAAVGGYWVASSTTPHDAVGAIFAVVVGLWCVWATFPR